MVILWHFSGPVNTSLGSCWWRKYQIYAFTAFYSFLHWQLQKATFLAQPQTLDFTAGLEFCGTIKICIIIDVTVKVHLNHPPYIYSSSFLFSYISNLHHHQQHKNSKPQYVLLEEINGYVFNTASVWSFYVHQEQFQCRIFWHAYNSNSQEAEKRRF